MGSKKQHIINYLNLCFENWATWDDAQRYAQMRYHCSTNYLWKLKKLTYYNDDKK